MNKLLLGFFLSMVSVCASARETSYYKLTRKVINNVSSTNVSGGQFITFISNLCYESDMKGIGVGHGTLTRNDNYSDASHSIYMGDSYWGKEASFKFNADKSVLNVVTDGGDVYVYKRTEAPAGVTTCSLIRKPEEKSGSSTGTVATSPTYVPYPVVVEQPVSTSSSGGSTPTTPTTPERRNYETSCHSCLGSGKCSTCNGKGWYYYAFDNSKRLPCPNCTNGLCRSCGGSGKVIRSY